jgi:hypothetical protein
MAQPPIYEIDADGTIHTDALHTFGVEQFLVLFMHGGRSARAWRTVRAHSVRRVFVVFLLGFAFDPSWFRVLVGSGFG